MGDGSWDGTFYGINSAGTGVGMLGGSASAGNLTILTRYNYLGQAFVDTWNGSSYGATPTVLPPLVPGDTTTNAACAISDGGIAVGRSNSDAVIYTQSGGNWTTTNLNTTSLVINLDGWSLTSAEDISHNGDYIVGYGTISGAQHAFLLTATFPGDANLDGKVDINDLTIVLANYGKTGMGWTEGEFTGDGTVDINDLTIVLANYGKTDGASIAVAPVPEPSTVLLAAFGLAGLLACVARKRR